MPSLSTIRCVSLQSKTAWITRCKLVEGMSSGIATRCQVEGFTYLKSMCSTRTRSVSTTDK